MDSYLKALFSYFNYLGDIEVPQDVEEDGALAVCGGKVLKVAGGYGGFKELFSINLTLIFPVVQRFDVGQTSNLKSGSLCSEVFSYHLIPCSNITHSLGHLNL